MRQVVEEQKSYISHRKRIIQAEANPNCIVATVQQQIEEPNSVYINYSVKDESCNAGLQKRKRGTLRDKVDLINWPVEDETLFVSPNLTNRESSSLPGLNPWIRCLLHTVLQNLLPHMSSARSSLVFLPLPPCSGPQLLHSDPFNLFLDFPSAPAAPTWSTTCYSAAGRIPLPCSPVHGLQPSVFTRLPH